MAWKVTNVMKERLAMISEYNTGDFSISELARRRGVSRKTAYKWIERYEEEDVSGLRDQSRAPHHHPNAISPEMEQLILEWKARRPTLGAPKIHSKLWALEDCPSESTVSNVLARHGLTRRLARRRRATPNAGPLLPTGQANDLWCVDFKGWFRLGNGRRCDPLTMSDAHSRYLLCCRGLTGTTSGLVIQPLFETTFRAFGLPRAIRSDNGAPFASIGLAGLSRLSLWWLRLGIRLERIAPGHPEQNGRHERIHRTLKESLQPPAPNLRQQQRRFDQFRQQYNEDRPHEALGQKPPAVFYQPSPRLFPSRLPPVDYPDGWEKRFIRQKGEMQWKGQFTYLTQTLAGQPVGLEPIGEGLWKIHFTTLPLALWDERKQKILPLK